MICLKGRSGVDLGSLLGGPFLKPCCGTSILIVYVEATNPPSVACSIGMIYGAIVWKPWVRLDRPPASQSAQTEVHITMPDAVNRSDRIRTTSNPTLRVVNWIFAPALRLQEGSLSASSRLIANRLIIGLKYIPGLLALVCLMSFSSRLAGEPHRITFNDTKEFQNWNYIRPDLTSRQSNDLPPSDEENATQATTPPARPADALSLHTLGDESPVIAPVRRQTTLSRDSISASRLLGPRYLCFVDAKQPKGYKTTRTGGEVSDYVFISYTRRQFYTRITGDPSLPVEQNDTLRSAAERDTATLIEYAIRAAEAAKVDAFWIDYECCQPEDTERWNDSVEDVYRICDIVRSAHSLVIVIGPPLDAAFQHEDGATRTTRVDWLHDWGRRLWTVPEALLTPSEHRISVYTAGVEAPEVVAKRNLASRVWDDAGTLRQLVEHYEASLPLTQLELISIALECLQRRQTEKRMNGDVAYALMGLLRQRPRVVKTDSDFQAFARLSLANDSDMLLERMLCLKPKTVDAAWHDLRDTWKARLWDIYPTCQVADIVDADTIMLGGAQGAVINWHSLSDVDYTATHIRATTWIFARQGPVGLFVYLNLWWIITVLFRLRLDKQAFDAGIMALTVTFGVLCAILFGIAAWAPILLRSLYQGDIADTQARFFAVEGRPDLNLVERYVFGWSSSRLKWVSSANPDQRSGGIPEALPLRGETIRQYTLVDTLTCSAMLFEAENPPSIAIACGREHGFLRTILCSYDSQTKTLSREAVVRMSTTVLDRMPKLDIFRFSLRRRKHIGETDEPYSLPVT